jgi:hypothetical protein
MNNFSVRSIWPLTRCMSAVELAAEVSLKYGSPPGSLLVTTESEYLFLQERPGEGIPGCVYTILVGLRSRSASAVIHNDLG